MTHDGPAFHGIRCTNLTAKDMWGRAYFPRAFTVALANYMGDAGGSLNLVSARRDGCDVGEISTDDLYGGSGLRPESLCFVFDSVFPPHLPLADGVPESDLVVTTRTGTPLCRLDLLSSVVPDASTADLLPDRAGPEMTARTPSLVNCALSTAVSLMPHREEALAILNDAAEGVKDWSSWEEMKDRVPDIVGSLLEVQSRFGDLQSPFLLQSVWRSEDDGPLMADRALDAFVWTDHAFTRLFLGSGRTPSDGGPTRPARCAVRTHRILTSVLEGRRPDLDDLISQTSYGFPGNKEFMVNGRFTNRLMSCGRLVRPSVGSHEVANLASEGFESMIVPERNLEYSVYFAARAMRG